MSSAEIKIFGWIIQPCLTHGRIVSIGAGLWVLVVVVEVGTLELT
jgi:hypothetical protein